jgi:hypothetical protein
VSDRLGRSVQPQPTSLVQPFLQPRKLRRASRTLCVRPLTSDTCTTCAVSSARTSGGQCVLGYFGVPMIAVACAKSWRIAKLSTGQAQGLEREGV